MRRAAEGSVDEKQDRSLASPIEDQDAVTLVREAFPIEMPDRHRPHVKRADTPPHVSDRLAIGVTIGADEPSAHRFFERFDERMAEKIVIDRRMPAMCREQYRRLAAVLHDSQAANRTKVVMVASAVAGEGKTLTAANVALTLSNSYRKRVLVIDGDLRRPTMHKVFRIETSGGLADGLDPSAERKIVVRQVTPTLALLPAGRPIADPMASLVSERMRQLIDEAREIFDWVIVDTPPLVLLPDANLLASIVDAALLVVKAESTPYAMVKRAMDALGRSRVLGVVLNTATVGPHGSYDGYDYSEARTGMVGP